MKRKVFEGLICLVLALLLACPTQAEIRGSVKWRSAMVPCTFESYFKIEYYFEFISFFSTCEIASPAIGPDGTIYVGSKYQRVYALDPADGARKWTFTTEGGVYGRPAIGPDGTIYVSSTHMIYALNPTGAQKWTFKIKSAYTRPAIGADGNIYVASDSEVYALNPANGAKKWSWNSRRGGTIYLNVGPDGTIYVGAPLDHVYADNPAVYALNPATGTQKWSFTPEEAKYFDRVEFSRPAIGPDGTIYVCGTAYSYEGFFGSRVEGGSVYALNPNGSQKWSSAIKNSWVRSPAIGADGTIYVGTGDGHVYALAPSDGAKKWSFKTEGRVFSTPATGADGTIYLGSRDYHVYALHQDGTKKWSFKTGGVVDSSPAIGADGTIYVGSDDHHIYALNPDGASYPLADLIDSFTGLVKRVLGLTKQ
jgi:outer membrane protein assembly factor BamB